MNLCSVTVQLPEYLVRAIELDATTGGTTMDDWFYRELADFAGTVASGWSGQFLGIGARIFTPATTAAHGWPSRRRTRQSFGHPTVAAT